ncbi:alpha-(1-_6)-mannopyranosyltransferase A [Corynebacterium uberis]|uniref:alpha-(1->6)-mannopyranosyltransferase A n=2 Tax=Corynebacterium TaxID=1716 RepID=UPI001D0A30DA|nr:MULTISPECIES: alpha-(1->6)-mannopyranosyltransferase A [Corynebacterium]MCZ9308294.1 alpha-(1->6)-mannopyranosyltransferase A [Corynebacterium sp. c6VSa_13]UDL73971.1 alpha-(1->6)-mannopyranosyltransferase A [Corynebacterium uberis]UDL75145.1 alpha-(1->6)-mannopyranosyltransferase A [Corynebacterium uberis]UDL77357.1 alpha-(1->6)-mannopyranosyltransferase A [Corynebacterium uberis]UDL79641.1 alpha-(1->6)-mannopyranosyltransferase A [Corynebacterium uberis]
MPTSPQADRSPQADSSPQADRSSQADQSRPLARPVAATRTADKPPARRFIDRMASRLPAPLGLGIWATVLITVASFGAGAIRSRGGVLRHLGLDFLAYGHGSGMATVVLWVGIFLLIGAWTSLGHEVLTSAYPATTSSPQPQAASEASAGAAPANLTRRVYRCLVWWIVPLIGAAPLLSRDVYSYLMQGAMVRDGFDPYTQGAAINPGPMLLEVSHDWRNTTTPYGPLHLWLGQGITRIVGDNITVGVILYKLVSIIGFAAIAWAIPRLATHLGGNPAVALWLGVANPVMILHLVGGMHNESIMVGLVSVGLVAACRRHLLTAVALVAVAVSLKATAAIALPFIVWMATNRWSHRTPDGATPTLRRRIVCFLGAGALTTILATVVVALVTWMSASSWGWLAEISGNSKIINPLALPSLLAGMATDFLLLFNPDWTFNVPLVILRRASMVAMLVGLVAVWWLARKSDRDAIRGVAAAYAVAFVFNSVTLPWYYASLISLVAVTALPRSWVQWAAGLSVVIALAFAGSGNHQLYNAAWMAGATLAAWACAAVMGAGAASSGRPTAEAAEASGPSKATEAAGATAETAAQ